MNEKCWCGAVAETRYTPPDYMELVCTGSTFHDPLDVAPTEPIRVLYLSGPMSGYPDCNYPEFNRVAAELEDAGFAVHNPASEAVGASYRSIVGDDIKRLIDCDGVALLTGWQRSRGAVVERQVATLLQKPVHMYWEWIDLALQADSSVHQHGLPR